MPVATSSVRSPSNKNQISFDELRQIHEEYVSNARDVMKLVKFIDLDVTAMRKILKKCDKKKLCITYLPLGVCR